MVKGHLVAEGDSSLVGEIDREGFGRFETAEAELAGEEA